MKKRYYVLLALVLVAAGCALKGLSEKEHSSEKAITLDQAPPAVKSAVEKHLAGAPLKKLVSEGEGKIKTYEAEYEVGGVPHSIDITSDGVIMAEEEEVAASALPAAVSAAIKAKFPNASIAKAESAKSLTFEVELKTGEKVRIAEFLPTGKIKKHEEKDEDEEDDDD